MSTTQTLEFLSALLPEKFSNLGLPRTPHLVVWSRKPRSGQNRSDWTKDIDRAAVVAARHKGTMDVHFGVALQDQQQAVKLARSRRKSQVPLSTVRGSNESAVALPAVWIDLDVRGASHGDQTLPPNRDAALSLLSAIPHEPSCLVDSGSGFHVYWFLDEPLLITNAEERQTAASLVRRVVWTVAAQAETHGWTTDRCDDLARAMRLPGTFNHKSLQPAPANLIEIHPERRYSPSHFEMLTEPTLESMKFAEGGTSLRHRRPTGRHRSVVPSPTDADATPREHWHHAARFGTDYDFPADFQRVYDGCSWIRWCHEHSRDVIEPDWIAALSIVGRCALPDVTGRELCHRMSRDHATYTPAETDAKLDRALERSGPRTCAKIAKRGFFEPHCKHCVHRENPKVTSPIVLGRLLSTESSSSAEPSPPSREPSPRPSPTPSHPLVGRGRHRPSSAPSVQASERVGRDGLRPSGTSDGSHGFQPVESERQKGSRVRIPLSHRENEVADAALRTLVDRERNLFQRGTTLVQVVEEEHGRARPLHRPPEAPTAFQVQDARLREILATHCEFMKAIVKSGDVEWMPSHPPAWVSRALLDRFRWRGLSKLEGMVEGPVLRADGSVLQEPGFDPASGLYYAPSVRFERVPERPTPEQVAAAVQSLRDAVCDFPFEEDHHFSAWLAGLLTPLARFAFKGPSPLNLIDANVRGAGKSLLADVTHAIITGRPAPRMTYLRDENELRKAITSIALKARQLLLIDNVRGSFGSPTLDLALTSTVWEDRLLGQNTDVELPLLVTWYVTGNNIELRGDLSRRCLHVRLESPEEKPERRGGFKYPRLLDWLEDERKRLLPAALTILVGYCAAKRPDQGLRPWGSYEHWSDLVRSAVVWADLPDPSETTEALTSEADAEHLASTQLVLGLEDLLASEQLGGSATAGEILRELEAIQREKRMPELIAALEELYPRLRPGDLPTTAQIGNRLRSLRGRNFEGRMLRGKKTNVGVVWAVERLGVG